MPFVLGGVGLLFLRAAVLGTVKEMVDSIVVFGYIGAFSLWSFGYRLYHYGHDLAPSAPVKVDPFMPPMFGYQKIANFEVYSYPRAGTYCFSPLSSLVLASLFMAWRERKQHGN